MSTKNTAADVTGNLTWPVSILGRVSTISELGPGLIVAWLLIKPLQSLPLSAVVEMPQSAGAQWVAFIVAAFTIGSILKLVGSFLFDWPVYDLFYKHAIKRKQNPGYDRALPQIGADTGMSQDKLRADFDCFNYAVTAVKASPLKAGADEIDGYLATSKYFRSLAVALLAGAVVAAFGEASNILRLVVPLVSLALLALWNFCTLRWQSTQRAYEFYLEVRRRPSAVASV